VDLPLRQDTSDERTSSWERNTDRGPNGPVEGFTKEFKCDAVELVRSTGRPIAVVARELGIYDDRAARTAQRATMTAAGGLDRRPGRSSAA
jgi:transposase-like protein